ncbi:MAG: B12-binding domain-containing protein [Actinomycetota bacterium]
MGDILVSLKNAVMFGELEEETEKLVREAMDSGLTPRLVLEEAMMPAVEDVGERFSRNEAFIPELIVAASAMERGWRSSSPFSPERRRAGAWWSWGRFTGTFTPSARTW